MGCFVGVVWGKHKQKLDW
jgi:hypothetical protein